MQPSNPHEHVPPLSVCLFCLLLPFSSSASRLSSLFSHPTISVSANGASTLVLNDAGDPRSSKFFFLLPLCLAPLLNSTENDRKSDQ